MKGGAFDTLYMIHNTLYKRGFSLVEVVIGTALILLSLTGLVAGYSFYLKAGLRNTDNLKAAFLLQEGVEAATLLRDSGWNNLSSLTVGTPYYLSWSGTNFAATSAATTTDGVFVRTLTFDAVYRRDSDKDIAAMSSPDAKTLDVNTKKLTVQVSWGTASSAEERQVITYLTNLFE